MNGLHGRMLRMPAPKNKKREILLLYGHHSSLERMFGFAEVLNRYGAVTMPDLPGFGGMQSFYTIGEKPTLDAYADYLAAFVQLRYKRRRLVIVAMSFSVPLVVRMLQRYPDLAKKVDFIVSTVGFVHKDDFVFSKPSYYGLRLLASVGQTRMAAGFLRSVVLRGPVIQMAYTLVADRHTKMKDAEKSELKKRIDYEKKLWKMNDVRTRMSTLNLMLTVDVCDRGVDLPMYHVSPSEDRYFNNHIVCQHMQIIFEKFESVSTTMPAHAPTVIASAKEAAPYVPRRIQRLLSE
jgi:pimeloyl-ACP methyl ester carboxylesterase